MGPARVPERLFDTSQYCESAYNRSGQICVPRSLLVKISYRDLSRIGPRSRTIMCTFSFLRKWSAKCAPKRVERLHTPFPMRTHMCACVYVCMLACVRACVCASMRLRVCVSLCGCASVYRSVCLSLSVSFCLCLSPL